MCALTVGTPASMSPRSAKGKIKKKNNLLNYYVIRMEGI
jgi:hypothetical protein